jgi:hypothetical protein
LDVLKAERDNGIDSAESKVDDDSFTVELHERGSYVAVFEVLVSDFGEEVGSCAIEVERGLVFTHLVVDVGSHKGPRPYTLPILEEIPTIALDTHLQSLQAVLHALPAQIVPYAELGQHIVHLNQQRMLLAPNESPLQLLTKIEGGLEAVVILYEPLDACETMEEVLLGEDGGCRSVEEVIEWLEVLLLDGRNEIKLRGCLVAAKDETDLLQIVYAHQPVDIGLFVRRLLGMA